MKTILIIIIIIISITFCGCVQTEITDVVDADPIETEVEPFWSEPPPVETPELEVELPYAFVLSPDFDRSEGITIPNFNFSCEPIAFDFGEFILKEYPFGEWSVGELEEKYGKAIEISGSIATIYYIEISGTWNNMYVLMQIPRNGKMSFDIESNSEHSGFYPLTSEDKDVRLSVCKINISGSEFSLPRGLIINQSTTEQVRNAYPVNGSEIIDSPTFGSYSIAYKYVHFDALAVKQNVEKSDIGYIRYYFRNEILSMVEIGGEAA